MAVIPFVVVVLLVSAGLHGNPRESRRQLALVSGSISAIAAPPGLARLHSEAIVTRLVPDLLSKGNGR
jgi:hypothetical protein